MNRLEQILNKELKRLEKKAHLAHNECEEALLIVNEYLEIHQQFSSIVAKKAINTEIVKQLQKLDKRQKRADKIRKKDLAQLIRNETITASELDAFAEMLKIHQAENDIKQIAPISYTATKKHIEDVIAHYNSLDNAFKKMSEITGISVDSKMGTAIWNPMDLLIKNTSALIGDHFEQLSWFIFDNNQGKAGLGATINGQWTDINTVDDLVNLIRESTCNK